MAIDAAFSALDFSLINGIVGEKIGQTTFQQGAIFGLGSGLSAEIFKFTLPDILEFQESDTPQVKVIKAISIFACCFFPRLIIGAATCHIAGMPISLLTATKVQLAYIPAKTAIDITIALVTDVWRVTILGIEAAAELCRDDI